MRFLLINHIQNARQSLKKSRVRSHLTMVGIAIGVASITAIMALGDGASKIVSQQVDSLGGNIAIIKPGVSNDILANISDQTQLNRSYAASTLTEKDILSIINVEHVQFTAPLMIINGLIKAESTAPTGSTIIATTTNFADISNLELDQGQFLSESIDKDTAVIGKQLSINVFWHRVVARPNNSYQGQTIRYNWNL